MNVFESRTLIAWLSCLLAFQSAQAQPPATGPGAVPGPMVNAPIINDAPGQAVAGNYFGYTEVDSTFDPLLRVDTRGGRLIGQDGFTRISAFMPYWLEDDALLYADPGAMLLYNPSGGASLNVGWRYFVDDLDRVFGLYAGYDYDPGHNRDYNQFSIGFESLGRYIDYRANGYLPFGNKTNVLSSNLSGPVAFNQNNIILGRVRGIESAMTGFDAELGGPIPILGRYGVSTYLGMYFFDGSDTGNVTGFSSRTQGQVNEDLTVGVQVSHDSVFQTDVQMQVTWTIPDGAPGRWFRQQRVRDRLLAPVVRNYRVIARNDTVITPELAINPLDNQPFFVSHINPNRTPGTGTGTFEDPYSQLSQFNNLPGGPKSTVDIIYVTARGDGTSTQLDTGVTLLNNQRLLSTAVQHTFTAVQGTFDLPGFIGGPLPVLSNNTGGNVVTFATGNRNIEVSGFTINGSATGNGIAGIGNQQVNINRNVVQNGLNGVRLTNLNGVGPANRSLIDDNDFINNFGDGFSVINALAAPLEIFITNNTATGNLGNGFRLQSDLGSSIGGRITGNSTANTGIGTSNGNNGLALFTNGGEIDFHNAANDWRIGGTDAADVNSFSDNGNFGINVVAVGGGNARLRIINNDISRNSLNGFGMATDSGTHVLQIGGNDPTLGNRIENNGLNGILLNLTGTSATAFNIQNNLIRQNGNNGNGGGPNLPPASLFDIDVVFLGGLTASQQAAFALAAQRWEQIITGDLPDVGAIDDIEITAEGLLLDGPGGFAGFGGPTATRPVSFLPFTGQMQFDTADLPDAEALGFLDELILHEMGHALGFGTIWTDLGLLQNAGSTASNPGPQFIGAAALAEHLARFGGTDTGVPVDNSGVTGTQDAHWRENPYDTELMTGTLSLGTNPISRVTIAQFQDLGYTVDLAQADPFVNAPQPHVTVQQALNAGGAVVAPAPTAPVMAPAGLATVGAPIGDGINISVTDAATISPSTILDNEITQSARHGIYVTTNAGVTIPALEIRRNQITDNGLNGVGSGIFLDRFDSSTINMTSDSNVVTGNIGDGLTVNSQGVAFGGVAINSFDNNYDSNSGNGANFQTADTADILFTSNRDTFSQNTLNGISALSEDGSGLAAAITLRLHNVTAGNNTANGVNLHSTDLSLMSVLIDSPVDPLFAGTRSSISGNDANGVNVSSEVRSRLILSMDNVDVQNNTLDGLALSRVDTSLLQANLASVTATGNGDDGIDFFFAGARHTDALQPLSGTPNSLNIVDSRFNSNRGNGMNIQGRADGVLVANVETSTFNANSDAGVFVETYESASFGVDPANRSIFNGVTVNGNGANGMQFDANSNFPLGSFQFVHINANAGNTLISGNTGNGIEINAAGNESDFLIEGTPGNAFTTQISGNTGDGVEVNVFSTADVVIRDVIIGGPAAGAGNGGNGVDINNFSDSGNITIGAAGDTTIIQGNSGDGVSFDESGSTFIAGQIENTQILDNDGHGLSVVGNGPLDEDFVSGSYFISLTDSEVRRNGLNGVNIVLNGHMTGNQFTFDNNIIANNGSQGTDESNSNGFFLQQDAQATLKSNANSTLFRDATIPPNSAFPVNPNNPALTGLFDYDSPYLNLTTALQSELVFTRNTVNFNGNNAIGAGDGLYLRVSTNSYLAADVGGATGSGLGNSFSGNTLADFRTGSFLATGTEAGPPPGIAGADPLVNPSTIFLDDTAQLDLRFKNNTGTDLNPSLNERAVYTNADPAKTLVPNPRNVQYFQVDGPAAQINNSNVFTLPTFPPGTTETNVFSQGNYNIRSVAAPIFPNPTFPPFGP